MNRFRSRSIHYYNLV